VSFTWDRDYRNLDQVEAFYPAYLARRDELDAAGQYPYNDSFRGHVPGIEGADEDRAIYMLQTLHDVKAMTAQVEAFRAEGAEPVESLAAPTRYTRLMRFGWYMGGTGLAVYDDVRVVPDGRGRPACILPKGRRTNGFSCAGSLLGIRHDARRLTTTN
jgi:hypothetical protein